MPPYEIADLVSLKTLTGRMQLAASLSGSSPVHVAWRRSQRVLCKAGPPTAKCPQSTQTYTSVDNSSRYSVFTPPVIDISNLLAGQDVPTEAQIKQVMGQARPSTFPV